jgi:serine/threonine-protein kinase
MSAMKDESLELQAPPVLGERYEIGRRLREEPWGEVWLARDGLLGADVALKLLPRSAPEWPEAQSYYEQEALLAMKLRHPEILGVFHLERSDQYLFLVQESFPGESLLVHLGRQQRFNLPQVLQLLEQLGQALDFAHSRGVIHQSLNPLNILLHGQEVRLANFSFPGLESDQVLNLELKAYDAPEVIYGDPPTPASNIFSLGVLGFRLVAGSLPYALTFDEPFPYRIETLPPDLEEVPLPLQNLLLRCLTVDPEERFPDLAGFLGQLRQVGEPKGSGRLAAGTSWEPEKGVSLRKPAAAGAAGSVLGRFWLAGQPLALRLKETAVQTGRAFLSSPRRQLWGLGLAGLAALLIWGGLRMRHSASEATAPIPVAALRPSPVAGIPPLGETAAPTPGEQLAPPAPAPAQAPATAPTTAPSPAAPAAGSPETARAKEERFMLVVATYTDQNQAQALLKRLKQDNFKARVVSRTSGGKTQYQVQVGPVTGAKAAENLAQHLKAKEKLTPRLVKMTAKTKTSTATPAPRTAR